MTAADRLIGRLHGVRQTGPGRWLARCPAHDDGRPSLSVCELDDGRTLAHCFAQCSVADIVAAVGLELSDLFPEKQVGGYRGRREREPFPARDVLLALADETEIAAIVCARVAHGYPVDWPEIDRLLTAVGRIANAAAMFRPERTRRRPIAGNDDEAAHAA
jgi:hypothetical protein